MVFLYQVELFFLLRESNDNCKLLVYSLVDIYVLTEYSRAEAPLSPDSRDTDAGVFIN